VEGLSNLGGLAICRVFIVATVCQCGQRCKISWHTIMYDMLASVEGLSKLGGLAICRVFIVATVCQCGQRCKISWHTIMYDMLVSVKGLSNLGGLAICRVFIVATVCQCGQRCKISWHTIMYDMLVSVEGLSTLGGLAICRVFIVANVWQSGHPSQCKDARLVGIIMGYQCAINIYQHMDVCHVRAYVPALREPMYQLRTACQCARVVLPSPRRMYMYTYVHVCIYVCIDVYVRTCVYLCDCVPGTKRIHVSVRMYVYVCFGVTYQCVRVIITPQVPRHTPHQDTGTPGHRDPARSGDTSLRAGHHPLLVHPQEMLL
jgi:hypothetical protein